MSQGFISDAASQADRADSSQAPTGSLTSGFNGFNE